MPYKNPEEAKKKKAEYYLKRKEYLQSKQKEYRENNKDKVTAKQKEWVENNKEHVLARMKKWREENPEKFRDGKRQAYLKNKQHYVQKWDEYAKSNPEKCLEARRKYKQTENGKISMRAYRNSRRKREEDASLGRIYQTEVYEIYKQCAQLRALGHDVEVDHIVPLLGKEISGLHVPWNLALIPAKENRTKTNKFSQV